MKIGITTFHRAHNFGAQMQMYALYNFLKKHGNDVWIFDYHCPPVEDSYMELNLFCHPRRFLTKSIYSCFVLFLKCLRASIMGYQRMKCQRFSDFLTNNFQLTRRFDKAEDLPVDFDVLITGSDQLWSYYITEGRREVYFLDNKSSLAKMPRKVAYAVSVEKSHYKELIEDKDYVRKALNSFHWVSVRERALADMLGNEIGIKADVVLDPSLFLTREDCLKIAIKPQVNHYLCVYRVDHTSYLPKLAKRIAKEKNLKIVYINAALKAYNKSECYGPCEILGYICYADAVLTSSFHGTAFSIINHKDFYSAYDVPTERVQNLLKVLGLQNRFLVKLDDYRGFEEVLYDDVVLNEYVSASQDSLLDSLK